MHAAVAAFFTAFYGSLVMHLACSNASYMTVHDQNKMIAVGLIRTMQWQF
jgi:hypothetical protein